MHLYFRQYAQQMGLQNTRAILPEQIDVLLNTSITDTVNQIIRENVSTTNDRQITDNSKIGQINALKPLYIVQEISLKKKRRVPTDDELNPYTLEDIFSINEDSIYPGTIKCDKLVGDYMFLIDFSVNYKKVSGGITLLSPQEPEDPTSNMGTVTYITGDEAFTTNYFPVRLIDDIYLADVLNDFVLKPSLRSPILTIYGDTYDFYFDSLKKKTGTSEYILPNGLLPYKFRCSYIKKPNVVAFGDDLGAGSVDCDLPDYLHVDIVKHAVDLYRIAVSGSLYTAQQREEAQQRENARNNYRTEQ